MDHVVYLDTKAKELEKLLQGEKSMIIRGAAGRKMPYGRVNENDMLYFIQNNGEGLVRAAARVKRAIHSPKMNREESEQLVADYQPRLNLTAAQMKRWSGKRYLVLIELQDVQPLEPFAVNRSDFGNMDDWLPVGNIHAVEVAPQP